MQLILCIKNYLSIIPLQNSNPKHVHFWTAYFILCSVIPNCSWSLNTTSLLIESLLCPQVTMLCPHTMRLACMVIAVSFSADNLNIHTLLTGCCLFKRTQGPPHTSSWPASLLACYLLKKESIRAKWNCEKRPLFTLSSLCPHLNYVII